MSQTVRFQDQEAVKLWGLGVIKLHTMGSEIEGPRTVRLSDGGKIWQESLRLQDIKIVILWNQIDLLAFQPFPASEYAAKFLSAILWPSDAKNQLIEKDPDAGKDWRQEEKATTEDEMVGWYHWLKGCEFEQTPGDGEGQGSLAWSNPWSHKESDFSDWTTVTSMSRETCLGVWAFSRFKPDALTHRFVRSLPGFSSKPRFSFCQKYVSPVLSSWHSFSHGSQGWRSPPSVPL